MLMQQQKTAQIDLKLNKEDGSVSEVTLKELVDTMGMSLKSDLLTLFEDDRKLKNIRFSEVFNLIETTKNMIDEHIQ